MKVVLKLLAMSALSSAALLPIQASAAQVADGTVSVAALYIPTVNVATTPGTFTASSGTTFETLGTGGFAPVTGLTGAMNGTISFSKIVGTTTAQTLANFFTFNDGVGGAYSFSATSAQTTTYNVTPGVTSSVSLYLLGTTVDAFQGLGPTATSLTLNFGNTANSPYSASATLSVPPAGAVPETASWMMMVGGFGVLGASLRGTRRKDRLVRT